MTIETKIRGVLMSPSKNSYVYKLGFKYAIGWYRHPKHEIINIEQLFGEPNRSWHYTTYRGLIRIKSGIVTYPERRWFFGSQRWNDNVSSMIPHWAVFKTEKDRTLALLTL